METVFGIVIGLIVLTIIVALHELGHGWVAKRNGVVVEEFGIGFPPRAWAKKVRSSILGKDVIYSLNWLPLGGFVKLQGEHDTDTKKGDYGRATLWQKSKILLAGVAANWLTAVVLLTVLAPFGIPKVIDNQFSIKSDSTEVSSKPTLNYVAPDSPAEKAGLKLDDQLVSVAGQELNAAGDLAKLTKEHKGQSIEIVYLRDGKTQTTTAKLRDDNGGGKGFLGASDYQKSVIKSTWSSPIVGVGLTAQLTAATYQGLGSTVSNLAQGLVHKFDGSEQAQKQASQELSTASQGVTGPVGLIGVILPGLVHAGAAYVIVIAAVIAISLASVNVLPIPALDGGRWFLTILFRILKRPLSAETEEKVNGYGFLFLIGLLVVITIADVTKFF